MRKGSAKAVNGVFDTNSISLCIEWSAFVSG